MPAPGHSGYAVIVLARSSDWTPMPNVTVTSVGPIEAAFQWRATNCSTQIELQVSATDAALDAMLTAIGEQAQERGGLALDARSLRPLLAVEPATGADVDPGPIEHHLPGFQQSAPLTGPIDVRVAARRAGSGLAPHDTAIADGPPSGWTLLPVALDDMRRHAAALVVVALALGALGLAISGVDHPVALESVPAFLGLLAVPFVLGMRPGRGALTVPVFVVLAAGVTALITVAGAWSSVLAPIVLLALFACTPLVVAALDPGSVRSTARLLRARFVSIVITQWLVFVIALLVVVALAGLAALLPGVGMWDPRATNLVGLVPSVVSYAFAVTIARTAAAGSATP